MSDRRKLQAEIDKCQKRVQEGLEAFDIIWNKFQDATCPVHKKNHESHMKKEIKKLQKLRDQVKSWASSNEVKEKSLVIELRKVIETRMERFKEVERENRARAFSKDNRGPGKPPDPSEKERQEVEQWLQDCIEALELQYEKLDTEMEALAASSKKRKAAESQEKLAAVKNLLDRHQYHIRCLEAILRLLDNESTEVEQIKQIQDEVNYYIENNQEPEFPEDYEINYDGFDLEDKATYTDMESVAQEDSVSDVLPITSRSESGKEGSQSNLTNGKGLKENDKVIDGDVKAICSATEDRCKPAINGSPDEFPRQSKAAPVTTGMTIRSNDSSGQTQEAGARARNASGSKQEHGRQQEHVTARLNSAEQATSDRAVGHALHAEGGDGLSALSHSGPPMLLSYSSVASNRTAHASSTAAAAVTERRTNEVNGKYDQDMVAKQAGDGKIQTNGKLRASSTVVGPPPGFSQDLSVVVRPQELNQPLITELTTSAANSTICNSNCSKKSTGSQLLERTRRSSEPASRQISGSEYTSSMHAAPVSSVAGGSADAETPDEAVLPGLLPPLISQPLSEAHLNQLSLIGAACQHMPRSYDSKMATSFLTPYPWPTPKYYPQAAVESPGGKAGYDGLSDETLFFLFYYTAGSKSQYKAAQSLKRRCWRFHIFHSRWFRRSIQPTVITDEYEEGNYMYFDFETWNMKAVKHYRFQYCYLEDRHLD